MSAPFNLDPQFGIVNIRQLQLLSLSFDLGRSPVAKKLQEVLEEKKKQREKDIADIIRDVAEANKCKKIEYKRRGKRKILWGLYEAEPEERISISIRGHYSAKSQT